MRLPLLAAGGSQQSKYLNATAQVWDLKSEPRDLIGVAAGNAGRLKLAASDFPFIQLFPGSPIALFDNDYGVQPEQEVWVAPVGTTTRPAAPWKLLAARSDGITAYDVRGDRIFLMSHQDAPTFKVLELRAGQGLADARTLLPARPDRVIESLHAASDALYVQVREGVYSHLLRVADDGSVQDVPLPFPGYISSAFTDPRQPGLMLTLESWAVPPTEFRYEPRSGRFVDLKLGSRPAYDAAQFTVRDLKAKAADGVEVPLSVVEPAAATGPQIVLMDAYGSYGISYLPEFNPRIVAFMREGAAFAVCHVRGGGELGEAWRLGGKDEHKPNTWRDLIACAQELIARGITTPGLLFIQGGSAGGITMGRALTERPDLFAGVIDQVPEANALRAEFSPNGPPNIPEFGTVTTERGFKNLLAMDAYQAVQQHAHYPAVLITTGLNDPRVAPWQPAKFAARLQASDTTNPVLLRVEADAGHGIGSTKTQRDQEYADIVSFIFWRAGRPGWQPGGTAPP
jgi:prolyl oligopeptidase